MRTDRKRLTEISTFFPPPQPTAVPHLLLLGVVSVSSIDSIVETTGVAEVLALRISPPERSRGSPAVGTVTVRVVGQGACGRGTKEHVTIAIAHNKMVVKTISRTRKCVIWCGQRFGFSYRE